MKTEVLLDWARNRQSALPDYLPDEKDIQHLPKSWLVNIIYACCGDAFSEFIKSQVVARNQKIAVKKDMLINVDPSIANAFNTTNHISTAKGKGAMLLKVGSKVSSRSFLFTIFCVIEKAYQD